MTYDVNKSTATAAAQYPSAASGHLPRCPLAALGYCYSLRETFINRRYNSQDIAAE